MSQGSGREHVTGDGAPKRTAPRTGALACAVLLLAAVPRPRPVLAEGMPRPRRIQVMKSVVLLMAMQRRYGRLVPVARGTGCVLDSSGLILTNNHVVTDSRTNAPYDAVAVSLTTAFNRIPRATCLASGRRAVRSALLDLAIIKCESEVNGQPLQRKITWSTVELGDSAGLAPGDDLYIVGYPGRAGRTITYTAGKISGFADGGALGPRAWIKTDAPVSRGVSGGAAFDSEGKLVGVPTLASWEPGDRNIFGMVRPIEQIRPFVESVVGKDWNSLPRLETARTRTALAPASGSIHLGMLQVSGALDEQKVREVVVTGLDQASICQQLARRGPVPSGFLLFKVEIQPDGRARASLENSTVPDKVLAACVSGIIKSLSFPAGPGPTQVSLVLVLSASGEGTGTTGRAGEGGRPLPAFREKGLRPSFRERVPRPSLSPAPGWRSFVAGELVDASTRTPVAGGVVLILRPGVSVRDLSQARLGQQVATVGTSNSQGQFRTRHALPQAMLYSIVVMAQGYVTVAVDDAVRLKKGLPHIARMSPLLLRPQAN